MKLLAKLLSLFLLIISCSLVQAQKHWRFSNPKPHGNNIVALAMHNDVIWQAGDRGQLFRSQDLDSWIPQQTGTAASLRAITFFKDQIYVSGEQGTIVFGTPGLPLNTLSLSTTAWLEGIASSDTKLVAVGDAGMIFSSSDGVTWTTRGNFTQSLTSVAYGLGQFACVGEGGFLAVSTDGDNWESRNTGSSETLQGIAFINDSFWIVGNSGTVLHSSSLTSFNNLSPGITNHFFAVTGNSKEILVAGDSAVYLRDLQTAQWSSQADARDINLAPLWPYYSAFWDGRLYLLGGRTGLKVEGFRTNDTAPLNWYSSVQPTRRWLWSLTSTPELYAAAGNEGTIITSLDGITWQREVVPDTALNQVLLGIGGSTNCLVAAGSAGTLLYSPNVYSTTISTNSSTGEITTNQVSLLGVYWYNAAKPVLSENLQGVAANASTYIVSGANGTILRSLNGSNWVSQATPVRTYLSSVAAGPNGFIASGDLGTVIASPDGRTWSARTSGVTNWIYAVRFVGGKYVGVGEEGLILTSEDGVQWSRRDSGTSHWLNDVTFVAGTWYVAANAGYVLTSQDSVSWNVQSSVSAKTLNGIVSRNGQIIAVGREGVVLRKHTAPPVTPVNILAYDLVGNTGVFLLAGEMDQRFTLESQVTLGTGWSPRLDLELVHSSGTLVIQSESSASPVEFYRSALTP